MEIVVHPTPRLSGTIQAGGSKNYTSRYILAATLAAGESRILNPAAIDDAAAMIDCCRQLGATIEPIPGGLRVVGTGGRLRPPGELNVRNAGAVARFLMAVCATLPEVRFVTPYPDSLGKRPHGDLLQALEQLGAQVESRGGCLPVTIRGGQLRGGHVQVSGARSSQFLTALLFLAPLLPETTRIEVTEGLVSRPAVQQTLAVLASVGIEIKAAPDLLWFEVPGKQTYQPGTYEVPGDWPGAAAVLCAAAVVPSDVTLTGLYADAQGERAVIEVLGTMGVPVEFDPEAHTVRIRGGGPLQAVTFDGDKATDAVMSFAAAAVYAEGTSRFYNVANLRIKESDRISDYCAELRKVGAKPDEGPAELMIHGTPAGVPGGVDVLAHHDHRLLMAMTAVGLRAKQPIKLLEAEHIAKSYPHFFAHLQQLGARLELPPEYQKLL